MRALMILLLAASLSAADVTGKWSGSYDVSMSDGQTMKGRVLMTLTQTGSELSGTVGDGEQQNPIKNAKIDGDRVTFETQTEGPLMHFDLHLEQDAHIRGEARGDVDGGTVRVKLDLTRQ